VCSWSDYLSTSHHAWKYNYHHPYLNVLKINLSHVFYLNDSGVVPSGPVPSPPSSLPTEASVLWHVYHWLINPLHHVISPSCHVWKGRSGLVRVVIWKQSVVYHWLEAKLCFDSLLWPLSARGLLVATVMYSFSLGMLWRGFLFDIKLLFVLVYYCPIQCYCYDRIIG
jgi:hypothetical protein